MTISNILGCTGSVIFALLASAWLPIFGPFLSLLIPLPFLFYSSKLGLNEGIKVCIAALLIVGIAAKLLGQPGLLLFCLQSGAVGLLLSELFRRESSYSLTVFSGTLLMLFAGSVITFFVSITKATTPVELIVASMQETWDAMIAMYDTGKLKPEQVDELKKFGSILINRIYPSLVVTGTGLIVWINVVVSKPLFRYKGLKYPDLGRADMWKAPEYLVWVLIAAGFSMLLSISAIDFAATNVLIIISVIYMFHGLSIVLFFFKKYNVPAMTRYIIYLLIIVQWLSMVILALMGLFDQWFDFRKIHSKAETEED